MGEQISRRVDATLTFLRHGITLEGAMRRMRFAGSWYPSISDDLLSMWRRFSGAVGGGAPIVGAIVPHAGLVFSGSGQAAAYVRLPTSARRVVILSPSHYHRLQPGAVVTAPFERLETPTGPLAGYTEPVAGSTVDARALAEEHAVELLLPFLAIQVPTAQVAAFLVGTMASDEALDRAVAIISSVFDPREDVLLVSSDFSHYGARFHHTPFGAGPEAFDAAGEIDDAAAAAAATPDPDRVSEILELRRPTICGRDAIRVAATLMKRIGATGEVLHRSSSADSTGDYNDFVNYRTVGYFR